MGQRRALVSVIMPVYNQETYVQAAVQSVLDQTLTDWELIIIDDGSRDGTLRYLSRLTDSRVYVIARQHCGNPARLRNEALTRATGNYIAFLDSDDLWMAEKLAVQLDLLRQHETARWSYTHYERIDHAGRTIPGGAWIPHSGAILDKLITYDVVAPMPSVMVERNVLDEVAGFNETLFYCEDYELLFRLAAVSHALAIPQRLCKVRTHQASNTARNWVSVHHSWMLVYGKLAATSDRQIKALCWRMCAYHALYLAGRHAADGERLLTLQELIRAGHYHPACRTWWKVMRILMRALFPRLFEERRA